MMSSVNTSGAWETVGGKKPSKKSSSSSSVSPGKKNGKSSVPRAEDVLPLKQMSSWYANAYETPPSESDDESSKKSKKASKVSKKPSAPAVKKAPPPEAPKKPSNVSDAAALIHAADLKAFLNDFKVGYPKLKELWVREVALYLNGSLDTTEKSPEFLQDPLTDLPASALYKETRKIITGVLEECSAQERQSVFDTHLANVAHYMAKGKSVNGYLTVIQILLEAYPNVCTGNVSKFLELRNSYQNQPHICLSLLWAVGQGGKHDLKSGLKAWIELMMPLMSLRHYHKFITGYLSLLLEKHTLPERRIIFPSQFLQFLQVFFIHGPASLNKEMMEALMKSYPTIKSLAIANGANDYELFPHLMRRLAASDSQTNDAERQEIVGLLQQCIVNSHEPSLSQWHQMYSSYVPQSAILLESLVDHWKVLPSKVKCSQELNRTLDAFRTYNSTNGSKEGIAKSDSACQILLSKMKTIKSQGWFPWKTTGFALVVLIVALVQSDCNRHKTLKDSNTGMLLSDIGLFNPLTNAFETSSSSMKDGLQWMERKSPEGMQFMRDGMEVLADKTRFGVRVVNDYATQGYILALDYANEHGPGLRTKAEYWLEEGTRTSQQLVDWVKENAPIFKDSVVSYSKYYFETAQNCISDVIDGKIEISDVKNFLEKKVHVGADTFRNSYQSLLGLVNKYMEK